MKKLIDTFVNAIVLGLGLISSFMLYAWIDEITADIKRKS